MLFPLDRLTYETRARPNAVRRIPNDNMRVLVCWHSDDEHRTTLTPSLWLPLLAYSVRSAFVCHHYQLFSKTNTNSQHGCHRIERFIEKPHSLFAADWCVYTTATPNFDRFGPSEDASNVEWNKFVWVSSKAPQKLVRWLAAFWGGGRRKCVLSFVIQFCVFVCPTCHISHWRQSVSGECALIAFTLFHKTRHGTRTAETAQLMTCWLFVDDVVVFDGGGFVWVVFVHCGRLGVVFDGRGRCRRRPRILICGNDRIRCDVVCLPTEWREGVALSGSTSVSIECIGTRSCYSSTSLWKYTKYYRTNNNQTQKICSRKSPCSWSVNFA